MTKINQNFVMDQRTSKVITIPCVEGNGDAVNLELASEIIFRIWRKPNHTFLLKTKEDASFPVWGTVVWELSPEDTDLEPGFYNVELRVTFQDGTSDMFITDSKVEVKITSAS